MLYVNLIRIIALSSASVKCMQSFIPEYIKVLALFLKGKSKPLHRNSIMLSKTKWYKLGTKIYLRVNVSSTSQ